MTSLIIRTRIGFDMVYNPNNKTILLFGGQNSDDRLYGDLWRFDGYMWDMLDDKGPSPRQCS